MYKNSFNCLFIFIFYLNGFGQDIELKGKITSNNFEDVTAINIINLSQKKGSISDAEGNFSISVKENDTLIFSAVQYEILEVVIDKQIFEEGNLAILMQEKNNLLKEVVINPYGLTGNLEKDAQNMPSYTFDYKAAGLQPPKKPRTVTERRLYTATSTSVDYILNSINGRIKKLRQLNEWNKLDELKSEIQTNLPNSFFVTDLGIKEEWVEDFIYFCLENQALKSYVQNNNELEIIEYLSLKANAYKMIKANEVTTD